MYELAKASLQGSMGWKDLVELIRQVPIDNRYEAARALSRASRLLRDTLENRFERQEAIESGIIADNLVAAMKSCPALDMNEFHAWNKSLDVAAGRTAWPKVPTNDVVTALVKNGDTMTSWLLRNNPGWDPVKAPSKSSSAIKKGREVERETEIRRMAARDRLSRRISRGKSDTSQHSSDAAVSNGSDSSTDTETNRKDINQQDFQSEPSLPAAPSQEHISVVVGEASTSRGVIEFGENLPSVEMDE
jgi:hypothetical protein